MDGKKGEFMMAGFVEPGATIGIIGGGVGAYQLARAAKNIGMRVAVLTTRADDVALQGADIRIVGTDRAAYERLAVCSVVTFSDEKSLMRTY